MRRETPSLYHYAWRQGWLKNIVWPNPQCRCLYTKEDFDNGVRLYGNASVMKKENPSLYRCGARNGWLKNTVWPNPQPRKPKMNFTKEDFNNYVQFYGNSSVMLKENPSLYYYAHNQGWLKDVVWPNPQRRSLYTKEEFDKAVQLYGSPTIMRKYNSAIYSYGHRKGWDKMIVWPKRKSRFGYTEEQLKKEVFDASRKYHSRGEFSTKDSRNYAVALYKNWLDEMPWLKPQKNPFTDKINYIYLYIFEQQKTFYVGETFHGSNRHNDHMRRGPVFEFAKRNSIEIPKPIIVEDNLDRKSEVRKQEHYWKCHYISLGYSTLNKGKTGEFSGSLGSAPRIWTRKKCHEVALLCSNAKEMYKKFKSAYSAASKNGWLKDYTHFTVLNGKPKPVLQYTKDGQLVRRWDSISSAARAMSISRVCIGLCCAGKNNIKQSCGYVWKYADSPS